MTVIGKPYKLSLRADAAGRALTEALAEHRDITVDVGINDGALIITVKLAEPGQLQAVEDTLSCYAVTYRLTATN